MGRVDALRSKRIYLDANLFIYAIEASPDYASFLNSLFDLFERGEATAVTSELTLAEVLAKPFAERRMEIAQLYEEMIAPSAWLSVVPVERAILVHAARLGPIIGLKLPDAIHVASAIAASCAVFLSNDRRLRVPQGMALVGLA